MSGPRNQNFDPLVLSLLLVLLSFGCNHRPDLQGTDPQKTFDHARQTFIRGDLAAARAEADRACQRFSGRNEEWAWRFRLLEAEILWNQGLGKDALFLLNSALPPQLASGDLAIKQKIIQGGAHVLLGHFSEADQNFKAAEVLSSVSHSSLTGEIARARGVLQSRQNDQEGAAHFFRESLRIARQQQDK